MAPKLQSEFFDELFTVSSRASSKFGCLAACLREDPLLELLLQNPQDFSTIKVADSVALSDLIQQHIIDKKVNYPSRATLGPEFTEDDYAKVCEQIDFQHQQFQQRMVKDVEAKVQKFKQAFPHLTIEELFMALEEFEFHEDEVLLQLTKSEFIRELRKKIAKLSTSVKETSKKSTASVTIVAATTVPNVEEVPTSELILAIETNQIDSEVSEAESDPELELESESESDSENDEDYENAEPENENAIENESETKPAAVKRVATTKNHKKSQRLRLDEALGKADMQGWSEARIRAFKMLKQNPNTYYYRFNHPGETQRNGAWSTEEHEMFMKRLAECGADGQWGVFSMTIPGRVGYQCSNYYRKLVEAGQVSDPNYVVDKNGKTHYIGGKTRARRDEFSIEMETDDSVDIDSIGANLFETNTEVIDTKILQSKSIETVPLRPKPRPSHNTTLAKGENLSLDWENPLPGFIDAITRTEVSKPAISPYGHVLSYDTWIRCLLNSDVKNTCPLTKQPLHKRQLTLLTHENIQEYRASIIDLCNKSK